MRARGYFSEPKYIELTEDEKKHTWQVVIWIYKGLDQPEKKRELAKKWNILIFKKWPKTKKPYETTQNFQKLWKQKDTFLVK